MILGAFPSACRFAVLLVAALFISAAPASAESAVDKEVVRARALLLSSPQEALAEASIIETMASRLPVSKDRVIARGSAAWLRGAALIGLNRWDEAQRVVDAALKGDLARVAPDAVVFGDLLVARATVARSVGNIEQALKDSLKAYEIFKAAGQQRSQAVALSSIGSVYLVAHDYSNALRYYRQAAEAYQQDPSLLVSAFANRGIALKELGQYKESEREFDRGLIIARQVHSPVMEARILGDLAATQVLIGNLSAAQQSVDRGLAILDRNPTGDWVPVLLGVAAQVAQARGQNAYGAQLLAKVFGKKPLENSPVVLRPFLDTGYRIYKARGDNAQALRYLEAYKTVDDRARSLAASANAALMSARFDFANQQARIAQLRANELRQQATIEQSRARIRAIVLGGMLAAAGLISSLLLFGIVSIRRSRDRERAANEELSRTNVELEKALAARTEFLATTSHEIRTPLNGILGMTQVLLADRAIDPPVREKIQLVHGAGQTMKALVDDILDVAKMANGEIRIDKGPMDLAQLLRDAARVWEGQAETKGIRVVLDSAEAPARIVEDEVRLRQIVFNLMSNAVKFTDRGEVRLAAVAETVDPDDPDSERRLRIRISDTGIGIPGDRLDDVFESFRQVDGGTTRRHGGTGLGLAICRNLARAMGGDVTVASVFGAGATFMLDLPLDEIATPVATAIAGAGPAGLADAKMLLVETNPLSQSILRAVLTPHVAAFDLAAGLAEAETRLAEAAADLVLADAATLGSDMGQVRALVAAVRPEISGSRIVLLWPSPDEQVQADATAAGVALLIAKPVNAVELVSRLKALYAAESREAGIAA